MIVFRIIGLVFVAAALMALGSDGLRSLESGEVQIRSFGELWGLLNQGSLDSFNGWAQNTLPGIVVDPGIAAIMNFPAWGVLGVIGILIAFLFRQRS